MWFVQPKKDYVSQMPWKHTDETAIMSWQIRARNYNVFVANCLLVVLVIVSSLFIFLFLMTGDESVLSAALFGGGGLLMAILIPMSMTHQTSILVYRFTKKMLKCAPGNHKWIR